MAKDYYLILGLTSGAGPDDVRAAYRRRAFEVHPDRSGGGPGPFQDLQEAYAVLSDPLQRTAYDRQRQPVRRRSWTVAEPLGQREPRAESFRQGQRGDRVEPIWLWDDFDTYHPGFEEIADRWWGNFRSGGRPKAEGIEALTVEVPLSREDARWGGAVEIRVPVRASCGLCRGHGWVGHHECWRCGGVGIGVMDRPVRVGYPAGLLGDYEVWIGLEDLGVRNLYLTVQFRVVDQPGSVRQWCV